MKNKLFFTSSIFSILSNYLLLIDTYSDKEYVLKFWVLKYLNVN